MSKTTVETMSSTTVETIANGRQQAELVRADQALQSFRDGGYDFNDAVGETIDNAIQAGARAVRLDRQTSQVKKGRKTISAVESFAISDNGSGVAPNILANILTVGFSTRFNDRTGIGRYGVGFKLASISQAKRLEVYTRPQYLRAVEQRQEGEPSIWTYEEPNEEGRIFMTYLDLDEIADGRQKVYEAVEVDSLPGEYAYLLGDQNAEGSTGTLIVWRKLDRLNEQRSYGENANEKISQLAYFLRRTYRYYIDSGLEIFLEDQQNPLLPYDPTFTLSNPEAEALTPAGFSMQGDEVDSNAFPIDGHEVRWRVCLTPEATRWNEGGGGVAGPDGTKIFEKALHIPDNEGKISFLRRDREISYTTVPRFLPGGVDKVDRYIGIEISFPPALDEYFQVRHIKRGAEPIDKLRARLRKEIEKPVKAARKRIRALWAKNKKEQAVVGPKTPNADVSGGRQRSEAIAGDSESRMPSGRAGETVTPDQEERYLRQAAADVGITDPEAQQEFVEKARQKPMLAVEMGWPGKGLLDIEHLSRTVVVKINRRHPFIQDVYLPLREAVTTEMAELDEYALRSLLEKAADGMDLLLFAYAKAENMHPDPDQAYGELREDWGKFAAVYLNKHDEIEVS